MFFIIGDIDEYDFNSYFFGQIFLQVYKREQGQINSVKLLNVVKKVGKFYYIMIYKKMVFFKNSVMFLLDISWVMEKKVLTVVIEEINILIFEEN